MHTPDNAVKSTPRKRRWPWVFLAAFLMLVGATQVYRALLQAQVRRELSALRADGYPADLEELQRSHPAVPDLENAALRILEAADYLALPPNAFRGERSLDRIDEYGPADWEALQELISDNAPALEAAHAAALLERSRFPVDYSRGFNALFPHLAQLRSLCQLLRAEAVLHSQEGRPEPAVHSVLTSLALARSLEAEPVLISQLVRIACLAITCSSLERVLSQHPLPEPQLAALAQAFRGAREAADRAFARGFAGETCTGIYCFTTSPADLLRSFNPDGETPALSRGVFPLYAWTGLRDRDQLFYLRSMRKVRDALKTPFPEKLAQGTAAGQEVGEGLASTSLLLFSRMLLPSLQRSIEKAAESEARLRCAEAALAIEAYRIGNNGAVPEDLNRLPAAVAERIPLDPIDGAPLQLRKLNPGYVVRSIGVDGPGGSGSRKKNSSRRTKVADDLPPGPHFAVRR